MIGSTDLEATHEVSAARLNESVQCRNTTGLVQHKPFHRLIAHFFNHQTHHRGQLSTLLYQASHDIGTTDWVALL